MTPEQEADLCHELRMLTSRTRELYDEVWSDAREHIAGCDLCYGSGGRHLTLCGACDEAAKLRKRLDRIEEALGL